MCNVIIHVSLVIYNYRRRNFKPLPTDWR